MTSDFPVPRSEIPRVEVSHDEYVARKQQMEGMVDRIVQEYEEFSEVNKRHINLRRWKQVGSRERCKLYRERPKYQTAVGALGKYGKYTRAESTTSSIASYQEDTASEDSYVMPSNTSRSSSGSVSSNHSGGGHSSRRGRKATSARSHRTVSTAASIVDKPDPQQNASVIADTMPKSLMIGERPGRLEDAMHSLVARNHEELAFVVVFLHKEVADCAILHTMEAPTKDEPYRYLGYKWFVKPSPTAGFSTVIKHRDSMYVEYTGITATTTGEVIGFHIMHSIDIDGFPDFHDRNCVRASQSICSIYYQTEENMVEYFMMGNIDLGGSIPFKNHFIGEAMFGMPRSIDAGESKRLTELVQDKRRMRAALGNHKLAPLCRLCRSEKKAYNLVSLVMCEICGHTVCSRCHVTKEVFESSGLLGRFNKFNCCKTCVVDISNTHLPTAKPRVPRPCRTSSGPMRRRATTQSSKASGRTRNWTATSETLYEEEEEEEEDIDGDVLSEDFDEDHISGDTLAFRMKPKPIDSEVNKLSATSISTDSTATDMSSSRTIAPLVDASFDGVRNSMVSEISDFDRSFMIIRNTATQQGQMTPRERFSRESAFSLDDLQDDYEPEFAKSQINNFSAKSRVAGDNFSRSYHASSSHRHDMVLYTKGKAGGPQYPQHQNQNQHHHHQNQSHTRGGGSFHYMENQYHKQPSGARHHNGYETQLTTRHQRPHARGPSSAKPTSTAPPDLLRNYSEPLAQPRPQSGAPDYSRDDLINRMQHLAQLAEATYHTTKDNESIFNGAQTMHKKQNHQPVENRNRFFYY